VRVRGEVDVRAPIAAVWTAMADIASHYLWMADAEMIIFTSEQRTGVGTAFDCRTRIGPFTTIDRMTVTVWDEQRALGVAHSGVVSGSGVFQLIELEPQCTRVTWTEDLRFPAKLGGFLTAAVAKPVLKRVWMGNLRRFGGLVEAQYR
jgi:carbon monoxide dehydrogenase subunit G